VKKSSCDEACEIVVVPCGGFASQAHGILTRSPSRQIVGHVFYRREVGWRIPGSHAAFVVAEDHVHDPMQAVLDGPMAADHWRDRQREQHQALALVFHLVDCAAQGISGPVTKEAALRAAAWCEYLEAHARRCYGLPKDDGLRAAQVLAVKLERGALEDGFTLRDVRRNQWRSLTTDEATQAALD
jgi:hypothetical protein